MRNEESADPSFSVEDRPHTRCRAVKVRMDSMSDIVRKGDAPWKRTYHERTKNYMRT